MWLTLSHFEFSDSLPQNGYGLWNLDQSEEMEDIGPEGKLSWRIRIKYADGMEQDMACYDGQLMDKSEKLYFRLSEYFETEEDGQILY